MLQYRASNVAWQNGLLFFCIPYEAPLHIILCKLFWDVFAAGSCLLNLSDEQLRIYTKPGNAFIDQKQDQKNRYASTQESSPKGRGHTSNWFKMLWSCHRWFSMVKRDCRRCDSTTHSIPPIKQKYEQYKIYCFHNQTTWDVLSYYHPYL